MIKIPPSPLKTWPYIFHSVFTSFPSFIFAVSPCTQTGGPWGSGFVVWLTAWNPVPRKLPGPQKTLWRNELLELNHLSTPPNFSTSGTFLLTFAASILSRIAPWPDGNCKQDEPTVGRACNPSPQIHGQRPLPPPPLPASTHPGWAGKEGRLTRVA